MSIIRRREIFGKLVCGEISRAIETKRRIPSWNVSRSKGVGKGICYETLPCICMYGGLDCRNSIISHAIREVGFILLSQNKVSFHLGIGVVPVRGKGPK